MRSVKRRIRILVATTLAVVAAVAGLAGAGPVAAHSEIVRAEPGFNTKVSLDADMVTITFTPALAPGTEADDVIRVLGPDGLDHATGPVTRIDGFNVEAPMELTVEGQYRVEYEVVSSDGDFSPGSWVFTAEEGGGGGFPVIVLWALVLLVPAVLFLRRPKKD